MPKAKFTSSDGRAIELEYDEFGRESDPVVLLVMGYTAQMVQWEEDFCNLFVDRGYRVVRFDNRDCGLSTRLDGVTVDVDKVIAAALLEEPVPPVPYTLSDMAFDAVALLDHLGVDSAHVLGASMGGMIAQTIAIEHPSRVKTLVSVMSQPGDPTVGQPDPEAATILLTPPPTSREEYIAHSVKWQTWQSKKYRSDENSYRAAARDYDRGFYPEGAPRQLAAIYASGSRVEKLSQLKIPTLVIHGKDDTLITPSGGIRTAEVIPGARLLFVDDMGHDFPRQLWPMLIDEVVGHMSQVR